MFPVRTLPSSGKRGVMSDNKARCDVPQSWMLYPITYKTNHKQFQPPSATSLRHKHVHPFENAIQNSAIKGNTCHTIPSYCGSIAHTGVLFLGPYTCQKNNWGMTTHEIKQRMPSQGKEKECLCLVLPWLLAQNPILEINSRCNKVLREVFLMTLLWNNLRWGCIKVKFLKKR